MLAKVYSMAVLGIDAFLIGIEADLSEMLPGLTIVGLPDGAVRESRERVMSAIKNCGFEFPNRKVTINMAPADMKKEGSGYDLPIAIGLLMASEQVKNIPIGSVYSSWGIVSRWYGKTSERCTGDGYKGQGDGDKKDGCAL